MLSPFPGMDPFLEDHANWPDFHHEFLSAIRTSLAELASPAFMVRVEERVYITDPFWDEGYARLVPDVIVTKGHSDVESLTDAETGVAVAPAVEIEELLDEEVHDFYLEIRDARTREVVTAIELLSPANKVKGSRGRSAMLDKRKLFRRGGVHWLEIDLLRAGERMRAIAGRSDYAVTLWRQGKTNPLVWFIDIRDSLPTVAVPLRPPFPDLPLALQTAFNTTYQRAYYADSTDYSDSPPSPPLKPADAIWLQNCLADWQAKRQSEQSSLSSEQ